MPLDDIDGLTTGADEAFWMDRRLANPWHQRGDCRLSGFDYSSLGAYYVTVTTQERRHLFGSVAGGQFIATSAGHMIDDALRAIHESFAHVHVDTSMVMPDHVHAILVFGDSLDDSGRDFREAHVRRRDSLGDHKGRPYTVTLGDVVGAFKPITTVAYIRGVRRHGWPPAASRPRHASFLRRAAIGYSDSSRDSQPLSGPAAGSL